MATFIENELLITGAAADLQVIIDRHLTLTRFDFNTIIPMPEHQPDLTKPNAFYAAPGTHEQSILYRDRHWYYWALKYWGTKANSIESSYSLKTNELLISFSTSHSPISDILLETLSIQHPFVKFCYRYADVGEKIQRCPYSRPIQNGKFLNKKNKV